MFLETIDEKYLLSQFAHTNSIGEHASFKYLQSKLNYQFQNIELAQKALQHKSFCHEFSEYAIERNNERMEFFGDAILDMVISEAIFLKHQDCAEGNLSKLRSFIVNEDSLFQLALFCGLDHCILLGKGEFNNKGTLKKSILSDAFEAIVAAIYLDSDFNTTKNVILGLLNSFAAQTEIELLDIENIDNFDPKTKLQNLCMKKLGVLPRYISKDIEGGFEVELVINEKSINKKKGNSKKNIIKQLADEALREENLCY